MEKGICSEISRIIEKFDQLPYLFIGTGLSMRYAHAPSWDMLLEKLWLLINPDGSHREYQKFVRGVSQDLEIDFFKISDEEKKYELNPQLASEIQSQFNKRCLEDETFEMSIFTEAEIDEILNQNYDYFKYYIAKLTKGLKLDHSIPETKEVEDLIKNNNKIAGVITTNYDRIVDGLFKEFGTMVGQDNLLLSNMNNIFQIFKIHGSCDQPGSIIITKNDYDGFQEKLKYLSAKMLTIFVEHPVIFLGYGIGDLNVRAVLKGIVGGLTMDQLERLKNNLIFICPVLNEDETEEIRIKELEIDGKSIRMTEILLKDYSLLYEGFSNIKSTLPIGIIRKMQNMLCNFVMTTEATQNIMVGSIEDPNINDDQIGIYIGKINTVANMGFDYYGIWEIIEDVLFDNRPYLMDEKIFEKTFKHIRSSAGKTYLPIYKYLEGLNKKIENIPDDWYVLTEIGENLMNTTEKSYTKNNAGYYNTNEIEKAYPSHYPKQFAFILANCENIKAEDLGEYLLKLYDIEESRGKYASSFKKLVAVYDFKKYQ
ncbi:SIR2 family protein [Acetobacterium wieringae]|uniref:SIR2 family NAD-dependent protein deacylase n=1 Tax=Acetobacterium wieringae TaxID=52694 RepID=UPI002B21AEEA|nr:SIR2 family protein [Acetobacterium wieringae]MEA4806169.1 SIR2 family protein [Acetobacterium wieringae]